MNTDTTIDIRTGCAPCLKHAGFSLIEVIVTIILVAIMAVMMLSVAGTALRGSAESYGLAISQAQLTDVIEGIVADYRAHYLRDNDPIATIMPLIGAAGTTQSNNYGTYRVVMNRRMTFTASGSKSFTEQANTNGDMLHVTIEVNGSTATTILSR